MGGDLGQRLGDKRPRHGGLIGFDAGRHHGQPHAAVHAVVEGRAEDDIGLGVDFVADSVGGLVDLEQCQVHAAGDIDQDTARPLHGDLVQKRVVDGRFGRLDGAVFALGLAGAHHGLAHLRHDRANVGEVEIDEAGVDHQVGDPAHPRFKHVVVINGGGQGIVLAARVHELSSGRVMEVRTDRPAVQLYTGNPVGFCLETQIHPDAINHDNFPSPIVRPDTPFQSTTIFAFSTE